MGLSDNVNPTYFSTERGEAHSLQALSNVELLVHMLFPSYQLQSAKTAGFTCHSRTSFHWVAGIKK